MTLEEYEAIPDKTQEGTQSRYYYEDQLEDGVLYLDYTPEDVSSTMPIVFLSPIEDFDVLADNPEYPQSWFRALKFGLAVEIAPEFERQVRQDWMALRDEALAIAKNHMPETTPIYFQPGLD